MPNKPQGSQTEWVQSPFDGEWLPDLDPVKVGMKNYRTLQNMRYSDGEPEGVLGYSKINTTALTTYTNIRTGFQLRTDRTQKTYTLVHAQDTSGNGRVFQNQTAIPDQGDFEATALWSDTSGYGLGRFAEAPNGNVSYCNEKDSCIWAGNEMRCAAFWSMDDDDFDGSENPVDETLKVNDTLTDANHIVSLATKKTWLVMSVRPLKGVKYYISAANTAAGAALTVKHWTGSWTAVSGDSDGTVAGGISMAQTGTYSFTSTASTSKPYHYGGLYLYAYLFELDLSTDTAIYHVSVDAPFQDMVDVWDGVDRQPIQVQASIGGKWEDYTLAANAASSTDTPIGADFAATDTTDQWIVMFDERMSAIRLTMLAGLVNETASVATVKYWSGSAWVSCSATDGTSNGGKTIGQTGLMSWTPPAASSEAKKTLFGSTGYAYQITFSVLISGVHGSSTASEQVYADLITGVPAQNEVPPYKFASKFNGRLMGCAYTAAKEGGRVDYAMTNGPDVWNGYESSMQGQQSLYFGGVEELTCAAELYNRFGANIFSTWLALKNNQTYLLTGSGPEDYRIYLISGTVGCPAPETLCVAEVGFEMADNVQRNVAMWLSYAGPIIFDGAVIRPIGKVRKYFDPSEATCINFEAIENARGVYDPFNKEYNLWIPSGSGQTTCNVCLVYDLIRKRWYSKHYGLASMPQCAFLVNDIYGATYIYGGIDTGYMMRLEHGTSWDGTGIEQIIAVGDFWPTGSIWDLSEITRIKLVARKITEDHTVEIQHYTDTANSPGLGVVFTDTEDVIFTDTDDVVFSGAAVSTLDIGLESSLSRLTRITDRVNLRGWTHGFEFKVTTSDAVRGFRPVAWGIEYQRLTADV